MRDWCGLFIWLRALAHACAAVELAGERQRRCEARSQTCDLWIVPCPSLFALHAEVPQSRLDTAGDLLTVVGLTLSSTASENLVYVGDQSCEVSREINPQIDPRDLASRD